MKLSLKAKEMLEGLAKAVESLLAQLRRRGAVLEEDEVDLTAYNEYRREFPRQDA